MNPSGRRIRRPREPVSSTCTGTSGPLDLPEEVNSRSTDITTFAELGTSEPVVEALRARSITEPFPVQEMVIADALAGHDLLVQSPTGSGKTLAFGVPLVDLLEPGAWGPQALILAPTRELASQIVDELEVLARARGLRVAAVYGGVGFGPQIAAAKKADVLVATPGRLEDLIARGAVELDQVDLLVLDEADRMLDMGFRPAVDRIVALTPDDRQTFFFSATLEGAAGKAARDYTYEARAHTHRPPEEDRGDIEHRFLRVASQPAKIDTLIESLEAEEPGRSLVFVRTKRGADRLVKRLKARDVEAVAMHGDKSQRQRENALARFERGEVMTLVATDVAARGIDVPDVMRVINYDAPEDQAAYVHRIGRTGRAGRTGTGISFVLADEVGEMRKIARSLDLDFAAGRTETRSTRPHPPADGPRRKRRRRRRRRPVASSAG
ncbi:MAG TPA: DEAD/DEAH box helicase [Solirubrobacterales bacterium]|nr:DEAD/DEAH box helicase [Solirubrobacterales bacterium]